MSTDRWRRTSPLAIIHFVWTTARGVADGWGRVATTFGITAVLLRYRTYLAPGIAIGMSALAAVAVLRWWFFRYRIAEDRIFIREGVVNRTTLDIPFDRIQGINVNRRLVERVVGLVTVVIDTPGTRPRRATCRRYTRRWQTRCSGGPRRTGGPARRTNPPRIRIPWSPRAGSSRSSPLRIWCGWGSPTLPYFCSRCCPSPMGSASTTG